MTTGGLIDRQLRFVAALRDAGLPVSLAESLDAAAAVTELGWWDREGLRAAFAATVLKRPAHRPAFDALFELWFPPSVGVWTDSADAVQAEADDTGGPPPAGDRNLWRAMLRRLLLDGDDDALRRFARRAVAVLGRADAPNGRQTWFGYRVMQQLDQQTLMASLLAEVLQGEERGGLAERLARQTIGERMRQFQSYVEAEVRRLMAEDKGVEHVARTATPPMLESVEFLRASREDLVQLRREIYPLARRLATRLTARRRLGRSGRLDFRRTVRASLSTGGVPVVTHHRPHKPHRPELTLLCDVSGSVTAFAHFTMLLAYALREQFSRVRTFAFVDTTDEVTRYFTAGGDVVEAMSRMAAEADVVWFDGHSDYGHAFEAFVERYPDAVGPRTSLLVLGDARTNYRQLGLPALRAMVAQARHSYWLNPEPRRYWSSGDSAAAAYADLLPMIECRNTAQLAEFVQQLLPG